MIIKLKTGIAVRRSNWAHCVCEIADIGSYTFWGTIVDVKTGNVVRTDAIFPIDDTWEIALDAKDVIDSF